MDKQTDNLEKNNIERKDIYEEEISLKEILENIKEYSIKFLAWLIKTIKLFNKYKFIILSVAIFFLFLSFVLDFNKLYQESKQEPITTKFVEIPEYMKIPLPDDVIKRPKQQNIIDKTLSLFNKDNEQKWELMVEKTPVIRSDFFQYITSFRLKSEISFDFYNSLKAFMQKDIYQGYLSNKYYIRSFDILSNEIKKKYSKDYVAEDFPVYSLYIRTNNEILYDERKKTQFKNYILSFIFLNRIEQIIATLQAPLKTSDNAILLTQDYQQTQYRSELLLFFIQMKSQIESIFDLRNDNLGENFKLISEYLDNFDTRGYDYFIQAKSMLKDFINREYMDLSTLKIDVYFRDIIPDPYSLRYYMKFTLKLHIGKYIWSFILGIIITMIIISIYLYFKKNSTIIKNKIKELSK